LIQRRRSAARQASLYDYDAVGNRTTSPLSGSHSADAANVLSQGDNFAYTYDANGNLVTRTSTTGPTASQGTTYHWNRRSQLTSIDLFPAAHRFTTATTRWAGASSCAAASAR